MKRRRFLLSACAITTCMILVMGAVLSSCTKTTPVETTTTQTETTTTTTQTETTTGPVTIEVLNPRGEVDPPPTQSPTERIDSLEGKKIALYWNSKQNGDVFWDAIEEILKAEYPTATILRYNGGFDIGDKIAATIKADGADVFMYGMGD